MKVSIQNITKRFGTTPVVNGVTLEIVDGELFFLLGPSGCGKTTLLRTMAGFYLPDTGRLQFGDCDVTALPPNQRNTGMVFQNYALWPHMTVAGNVAYGLDVRKVPGPEKTRRVAAALAAVRMGEFSDRPATLLSGGQQQRVALARALVVNPDVLLLDEPLSNLDAKLRLEMREEIRRLHKATGLTTIYVTHDQAEALSLADRVAVMNLGRIEQVGTPRELYQAPVNDFVRDFLGAANFVEGLVTQIESGRVSVSTPHGGIVCALVDPKIAVGQTVTCVIRPTDVVVLR